VGEQTMERRMPAPATKDELKENLRKQWTSLGCEKTMVMEALEELTSEVQDDIDDSEEAPTEE
jgi:hypothetical protein